MDNAEGDDELKLFQASSSLLSSLERGLPKLLWKRPAPGDAYVAHSQVKARDLHSIILLIQPFQGEPQLLDAKLNTIVPPIVDAYLQYLSSERQPQRSRHVEFETAICSLLYTLCKIRGYKVIVGFFNNEPRSFLPIIQALERSSAAEDQQSVPWQVSYTLLRWLWHLLLVPFDLVSISAESTAPPTTVNGQLHGLNLELPPLILRILRLGLKYLTATTKTQDAAAALLARLVTRPDTQKLRLADALVEEQLQKLQRNDRAGQANIYESLGSLRFLAQVTSSAELSHLVPSVYRICNQFSTDDSDTAVISNAVAKKIVIKIFRNSAVLSLRAAPRASPLLSFLETTGVLEDVIDHLLRSLAEKDTPVRYAAAKAISLIVLELEPSVGHEVIQAILDTFKEDLPRSASMSDFSTVDPLKWHGLTLALAHCLFTRSASPDQMADILRTLISALQFQQRTATGTALGANVRDAANFGIWSLARRYTTAELSTVSSNTLFRASNENEDQPVIQVLAIQLLLSACLDPAGNIRRGSSAALQELIGRHPDQVHEGIPLVQIVEYQAVGLRQRAMIEVANRAATLNQAYWRALLDGLLGWRGLGSADAPARGSAAESISTLVASPAARTDVDVLEEILLRLRRCMASDIEDLQGLVLTAAQIVTSMLPQNSSGLNPGTRRTLLATVRTLWSFGQSLQSLMNGFSPRVLHSELPAAAARYLTAVFDIAITTLKTETTSEAISALPWPALEAMIEQILDRHEESVLLTIPGLVRSCHKLKHSMRASLSEPEFQSLADKVRSNATRTTLRGAGRAIALGALAAWQTPHGLMSESAKTAVLTVACLIDAVDVDWRIIGARALKLIIEDAQSQCNVNSAIVNHVCSAVCRGLNDYTIDERGDVGSLVRLQAIDCASKILATKAFQSHTEALQSLKAGIYRLSLEKLDRVRLQAARCRSEHLGLSIVVKDVASASSTAFFRAAVEAFDAASPVWIQQAIVEGCTSCCGNTAEPLLQASRSALAVHLETLDDGQISNFVGILAGLLNSRSTTSTTNLQSGLELLAFLLDARLIQHITEIKWRNLLSFVQKAHYKSNDIPKILSAVHVYTGLAEIPVIRAEVLKKLIGMLNTNPYPRVRRSTTEALWLITADEGLANCDWAKSTASYAKVLAHLRETYVA